MGQIGVDHAAVAHDRDALAAVLADDPLDRSDRAGVEGRLVLAVLLPDAVEHRDPARVVRGPQLLDGNVLRAVLVVLGDVGFDHHLEVATGDDGDGGLLRSAQRTGIHRIEVLGCEILTEMLCLLVPLLGEFGVGHARVELAADRERVSDQQEFHRTIDKQR